MYMCTTKRLIIKFKIKLYLVGKIKCLSMLNQTNSVKQSHSCNANNPAVSKDIPRIACVDVCKGCVWNILYRVIKKSLCT